MKLINFTEYNVNEFYEIFSNVDCYRDAFDFDIMSGQNFCKYSAMCSNVCQCDYKIQIVRFVVCKCVVVRRLCLCAVSIITKASSLCLRSALWTSKPSVLIYSRDYS